MPALFFRATSEAVGRILHAGAGWGKLPDEFAGHEEVRLDLDPDCKPDILASITDMGEIGSYDIVYSCHCLEHLYPHDVPKALTEFWRVLSPGGVVIIRVPDLQDARPTDEVIYESPAGPISGLDLYYGHRPQLASRPHMAHHMGFVAATLEKALVEARFVDVKIIRDPEGFHYELFGRGLRPPMSWSISYDR